MHVCIPCDKRPFSNKEALQQHLKTSSAWHPFCGTCDKRFSSEVGYESHMAAKHPPTYDCQLCSKQFGAPFALEDHYRGSPAHPNCSRCGKGFKDNANCQEHLRVAHPKVVCVPCGDVVYEDQETLERHYATSDRHPSCPYCRRGLKDDVALVEHLNSVHSDLSCELCDLRFSSTQEVREHYSTSSSHPKCQVCSIGLKNEAERESHMGIHTSAEQKDESTESASPSSIWAPSKFPVMETSSPVHLQPTDQQPVVLDGGPASIPFLPSVAAQVALISSPSSKSIAIKSSTSVASSASPSRFSPIINYRPPVSISPFLPMNTILPATSTPICRPSILHNSPPKQPNLQQIVTTRQAVVERSETPLYSTGFTPISPRANMFRDLASLGNRRIDSPDLRLSTNFTSPIRDVQAPTFSPTGLLPPGRMADQLWSSRENVQVPSNTPRPTVHSPEKPIVTNLAWSHSPPQEPMYNQHNNYHGLTLRERFQPASSSRISRSAQFSPPQTRASTLDVISRNNGFSPPRENRMVFTRQSFSSSTNSLIDLPVHEPVSPTRSARSVASTVNSRSSRRNIRSPGRETLSETTSTGSAQTLLPRRLSPPYDFSSRLYPGSARQALRQGSVNPTNQGTSQPSNHTPLTSTSWRSRQALSDTMNWRDVIGQSEDFDTAFEETPILCQEVETPRAAESPKNERNTFGLPPPGNELAFSSPSAFSSLSSVMSNELENLTGPDPAPQTTEIYEQRSSFSQIKAPEISFTTSIDSFDLRSPDVVSPIGLEPLPVISPLPDTPIDLSPFDIPEAHKPLPESMLPSPTTVVTEVAIDEEQAASIYQDIETTLVRQEHSTSSSPLTGSYLTSPQEPDQLTSSVGIHSSPLYEVHVSLSSRAPSPSPVTSGWDQFMASGDEEDNENTKNEKLAVVIGSPAPQEDQGRTLGSLSNVGDPCGSSRDAASDSEALQTVETSVTSLPSMASLLHCRACKTDPCSDITATLCGHIFCNSCITDAVIKTSRCPVCMTPTLLYCLFKLDLAA